MSGRTERLPVLLLAAVLGLVLAGPACVQTKDGPSTQREPPNTSIEAATLPNGVYAVLSEATTRDSADMVASAHLVLPYDRKYTGSSEPEPLTYVAVDTSSWVPLILEGAPDTEPDGRGHTLLTVALASEYGKALEDFTIRHLNGRVAIILGGEIVTMHKVRSVIREGKIQITRCDDNACEVLKAKLVE